MKQEETEACTTRYLLRTEDVPDTECSAEETLPDYLPEIRRILRTDTAFDPVGCYLSADGAEFAGTVHHTLLYTDPEGGIASVPLQADFDFATKSPAEGATERTSAESVLCRPQGPRKVSIRTRVRSRVCTMVSETFPTQENLCPQGMKPEELELLCGSGEQMEVRPVSGTETEVEETVAAEGIPAQDIRVICTRGEVVLTDVVPKDGGILCRGECRMTALLALGNGVQPIPLSASVPVEQELETEGEPAFALASGCFRTLEAEVADDGSGNGIVTFRGSYELTGLAVFRRPCRYVRDLYAPTRTVSCRTEEKVLQTLIGGAQQTVSVGGNAPKKEEEREATGLVDATGRILSEEVTAENGKVCVKGEWEAQLILSGAPDTDGGRTRFFPATCRLPYRVELHVPGAEEGDCTLCRLYLRGVRCRLDGDAFLLSAEMQTAVLAYRESRVQVAMEASLPPEEPVKEEGMLLLYPDGKDTLWSIGKAHHRALRQLAQDNGLPDSALQSCDQSISLDGMNYILIR